MGAEICKPAQNQKVTIDEMNIQSKKGCFQVCYKKQPAGTDQKDIKINPIQFSDLGSDRVQTKKQIQIDQKVESKLENGPHIQSNQFFANQENSTNSNIKENFATHRKCLEANEKSGNRIELVVVTQEKSGRLEYIEGQNDYEPLSVPYSVIKLMIKPEIFKQLKNVEKIDFDKIHGNPNSQTFRTWKLQSKGFYTNRISDGRTIIVTDRQFYIGHTKSQSFVPQDRGLIVTQKGYYKGHFKDGKAHGKGIFATAHGNNQCEGTWKLGSLQKGRLETEQYKYNGDFENNIPHGAGTLQLKLNKVKYIGGFVNGLFEDENAHYECQKYTYRGQFQKGKKNGKGELIQNQKTISKNLKTQLKSARKFHGEWKDDIFQKPPVNQR